MWGPSVPLFNRGRARERTSTKHLPEFLFICLLGKVEEVRLVTNDRAERERKAKERKWGTIFFSYIELHRSPLGYIFKEAKGIPYFVHLSSLTKGGKAPAILWRQRDDRYVALLTPSSTHPLPALTMATGREEAPQAFIVWLWQASHLLQLWCSVFREIPATLCENGD